MTKQLRVAGTDLSDFVEAWLRAVDADTAAQPRSLLKLARTDPVHRDRYGYGMAGLMAHIAPRVWGETGTREEVLLFAVLACYQHHLGHYPRGEWPGPREHVSRAFAYVESVGEAAAASTLRAGVAHRSADRSDDPEPIAEFWAARSVGQRAAHEQTMANGDMRDLRAAQALDGTSGGTWDAMPSL